MAGIKNGELNLLAINAGFTVLITNDQNPGFQQMLTQFNILFININQPSNRYEDTLPAMLNIKEWMIKKGMDSETIIKSKNYWVFSQDCI